MKKSIIVFLLLVFLLVGMTFCLFMFTDIDQSVILAIVFCYIFLLVVSNVIFTYLYVVKLRNLYQKGEYEIVIKNGNWLIKEWLPNGSVILKDSINIQIAASYFSLYDDENFMTVLKQNMNGKMLGTQSYWKCVLYFVRREVELFNSEYTKVFQPLVQKETNPIAKKQRDTLQLMALLINGNAQSDTKEKLLLLLNSTRTKDAVASY